MDDRHGGLAATLSHFLHRHFLVLLIGAYALAALAPEAGIRFGGMVGTINLAGVEVRASAPAVMLGFLLFAAGLAVRGEHLRGLFRRPAALAAGLAANVAVPVVVLLVVVPALVLWPDLAEVRDLVVGLVLVAAMPVAGSSAGWACAADGDCALSLGLVLLSTLASPVITPAVLAVVGAVAPDGADESLRQLAAGGAAGTFLLGWVLAPTFLGLATRKMISGRRADAAGPAVKAATTVILLGLCYLNAARCLPAAAAEADWDFLALVLAAAAGMCGVGFAAGFGVAHAVAAGPAQRASLVFGLGMANNGTGLVLASTALPGSPAAMLPLVAYNLVQHLIAGMAGRRLKGGTRVDDIANDGRTDSPA